MTRHLVLGNRSLLVNIDQWLQTRDLYYPHVGQENHLAGNANRIGVFVDGKISWINGDEWQRDIRYLPNTLVGDSSAVNRNMACKITMNDCVHHDADVFIKKLRVRNLSERKRTFTLFFHQDFKLYGDGVGDTAGYDPVNKAIFHYKRMRYFLINVKKERSDTHGDIFEYNIGGQGTSLTDASDGKLAKNPIAQGTVDSILSIQLDIEPNAEVILYYWLCCGRNFAEIIQKNEWVLKQTPDKLIKETEQYWRDWIESKKIALLGVDKKVQEFFNRSLLIINTQIDKQGAIVAANDSDNMQFNRDTYSYVWPRDAALVAIAMQRAGRAEVVRPFYEFCKKTLSEAGCFLHKYNPDGSLGSSWHPYVTNEKPQLPIQEDSTALVLAAFLNYYEQTKDKRFIENYYLNTIKPMADFLVKYRYKQGIPRESYDLWEERRGIFTYTCNTVCLGLSSAAKLAGLLKDPAAKAYSATAKEVHDAVQKHLYDPEHKRFARAAQFTNGSVKRDMAIESSLFSTFAFCGLPPDDERVVNTMNAIREKLTVPTIGGIARYEGDAYYAHHAQGERPGNPWFVCTAWIGKWLVSKAKTLKELEEAKPSINWMMDHALPTGVLPEQLSAVTGEPLSVSPLTWAHAAFITLILDYSEKYKELAGKTKRFKR